MQIFYHMTSILDINIERVKITHDQKIVMHENCAATRTEIDKVIGACTWNHREIEEKFCEYSAVLTRTNICACKIFVPTDLTLAL